MITKNKILICDDEEGVRESLKLILGDYYPLVIVESSLGALQILAKDPTIKLALFDINLPQMNGLELLNEVKDKYKEISVIMITGYKSTETASEAARFGASGYIVKPFKTQEILDTIVKNLPKQ